MCRIRIRHCIGLQSLKLLEDLPIAKVIKDYLKHKFDNVWCQGLGWGGAHWELWFLPRLCKHCVSLCEGSLEERCAGCSCVTWKGHFVTPVVTVPVATLTKCCPQIYCLKTGKYLSHFSLSNHEWWLMQSCVLWNKLTQWKCDHIHRSGTGLSSVCQISVCICQGIWFVDTGLPVHLHVQPPWVNFLGVTFEMLIQTNS